MSKKLSKKIVALLVVVAASMVAMAFLLYNMQSQLTRNSYVEEMQLEAEELETLLAEADEDTEQNTIQFDSNYQSKAAQVAFMAQNDAGFEISDTKMSEYQKLLGVDNVLVVNAAGDILASAGPTKATFSYARYNRLRETLKTGKPSKAVEIDVPERNWHMRYYSARIDDNTMVVIEQSPESLRELIEATGSTASVLSNIALGQHGYVFAASARDYIVEYHPDESVIGSDIIDLGFDPSMLEDGAYATVTVNGEELFCGVRLIDDMYYICAVPESDMNASGTLTVGVILFAFFVVIATVALYGVFVLRDDERRGHEETDFSHFGPFRFNRKIAGRAAVLSVVGFLGVLIVSYYMQTLFALSSQSLTNNERVSQIATTLERSQQRADDLTQQFSDEYLAKAKVAAYILDQNPSLANHDKLAELSDLLNCEYLFVFNGTGKLIATDSNFTNFTLSQNPEDQSYEFNKMLQGVEYIVQDPMPDEVSGDMRQYIAAVTHDEKGDINGFVQLSVRPTRLEQLLATVTIDHVLDGVQTGAGGFAFAVDKTDKTIAYYPDEYMVGKVATEVGMTDAQLKDGFSDYITINGETFYASASETDGYYVFVAGDEGHLMAERGPLTIATGCIAVVCLAIIFFLLTLEPGVETVEEHVGEGAEEDGDARMVNVTVGGRTMRTESAASRWLNRSFHWNEMSPEQKLGTVLRWFASLAVIVICVAVIFKDQFFQKGSIFSYILGGTWERGLNIFAITASLMFACVAITIAEAVQRLLRLISRMVEARGVTLCRLLASFIKYGTVIGMLYWCLALVGVDSATLLASAGLLTLAISLGAKDLVADIIAGMFIIFEGEFRVGDIIQVGGQRGTVVEIGVRTTKINDGSGNILVMRNSGISNVVNMTKEHSYAAVEVGIEYGESLERVENVLAKELPNIKKRLPAIIDGPFYKGVTMLADNSVNIKIVAECAEKDRVPLTNDLNREMKLMFDKYDISIPYPQVVINQPTVFKKATAAEKRAADAFNAKQKEAVKHIGDENEDFDEFNDTNRH